MIEIFQGSNAYKELLDAFSGDQSEVRKISLDIRDDGIAIKIKYMWSPTLRCTVS